mmetsp:Transcript_181711/g.576564  ORF Transcript_181711/g.576564 Transcript_181711/m.576564 type:complete len:351 (-) Transcript_181711:152-1204(-)
MYYEDDGGHCLCSPVGVGASLCRRGLSILPSGVGFSVAMYYEDDGYYYGEEGYEADGADYDASGSWAAEPGGHGGGPSAVICANGPSCKFKALGVCRFFHPEAEDEEGAEEAWEENEEDWKAWEEPAPQEPKVFRMVVPAATSSADRKRTLVSAAAAAPAGTTAATAATAAVSAATADPVPAAVPGGSTAGARPTVPTGPKWNVLVNSQPTPAKAGQAMAADSQDQGSPSSNSDADARSSRHGSSRRTASVSRSPRRRLSASDPAVAFGASSGARRPVELQPSPEHRQPPRRAVVRLTEAPQPVQYAVDVPQYAVELPQYGTDVPPLVQYHVAAHPQDRLEPLEPPPGVF